MTAPGFTTRRWLELRVAERTLDPIEGPRPELVSLAEALAARRSITPRWEDRTAPLARDACPCGPEPPW